jgi:hydrogenase expression/formation protein HypD
MRTLARANPSREIMFFAVGFGTTAPANAMAVRQAAREQFTNFSMLVSQVLVPPAIEVVPASSTVKCGLSSQRATLALSPGMKAMLRSAIETQRAHRRHRLEPPFLLECVLMLVAQLERGLANVENQYARAMQKEDNRW